MRNTCGHSKKKVIIIIVPIMEFRYGAGIDLISTQIESAPGGTNGAGKMRLRNRSLSTPSMASDRVQTRRLSIDLRERMNDVVLIKRFLCCLDQKHEINVYSL
jgi:hypothetical protein